MTSSILGILAFHVFDVSTGSKTLHMVPVVLVFTPLDLCLTSKLAISFGVKAARNSGVTLSRFRNTNFELRHRTQFGWGRL